MSDANKASQEPVTLEDGTIDVYPSDPKKVVKKVLTEGTGEKPTAHCKVQVHYVGTLLNGTKFDSSRDRNEYFSFELGANQVIKGWDIGVASMKVGEKSDFTIASDYAYGERGAPPNIPPNATLKFEIELFSFEKIPHTDDERMQYAAERKNAGNEFVKQKEYQKAIDEYRKAIEKIEFIHPSEDEKRKEHEELLKSLFSNMGLCHLKLDQFLDCVNANDRVLRIQPDHLKAIYRRAVALRHMGEYDPAVQDLAWCAKQQPNDAAIRQELELARKAFTARRTKERQAFSGLFNKLQDMEAEDKAKKESEAAAAAPATEEKAAEEKPAEEKPAEEKKEEAKPEEEKKDTEEPKSE